MSLFRLVWSELRERPSSLTTSLMTVLLGVSALVAIRHITVHSEREVARQLETLGANILVLPRSATLQDYYAADLNGQTLPEEHVSQILLAGLTGVEKLSPKLCVPAQVGSQAVTLTGILPQQEFQAKAAWQTVALFTRPHVGCKKAKCGLTAEDQSPEALATRRSIEKLGNHEAVLGCDVAARLDLETGDQTMLLGEQFQVVSVLPSTGTVDDSRVFAHLHTVQRLAKTGEVVSAIEVMGCCEDAAGQLVPDLAALLPESRIVTISQVVQTQVGVNRLMSRTSVFVLIVLVAVGGVSVASSISANVRDRRKEIGTLMALGAPPRLVARMFLLKAGWLGLAGGLGGGLLGVGLAVACGPQWAGVSVSPLPGLLGLAVVATLAVALIAAYWPARSAAQIDPCVCFREV